MLIIEHGWNVLGADMVKGETLPDVGGRCSHLYHHTVAEMMN